MFHVKHFKNKEPFVRGIVFSSFINVVSKIILFATSLLLANFFGANENTDIYFYLYSTLWLMVTVFSSLHVSVIIPEAMHRRVREGEGQAMRFLTLFFWLFLIASIVVVALIFLDPVMWVSLVSKYKVAILQGHRTMILAFLPLFSLILITQYLVDILNAYRYFTLPVLTGLINNILTLIFLCLFYKGLGLFSMVLALYIGYLINLGWLIYLMKRDFSWDFSPHKVSLQRLFKQNFWVGLLGNIWNFVGKYATNYFLTASGMGLLTAYNYGQKITNVPTEAITNQFSAVAAIRLNELVAQDQKEKLKQIFAQLCKMIIFILVPIAVLFYFYAEDIISLFYLRGEFGVEDVKNSAFFMRYLGFLLPLYGINTMVTRLYNAGQIIRFSTIYSVISNVLLVGFLWVAFSYWGIWGIPFALLAQNLLNVLVAQIFVKRFFKGIGYGRILGYFGLFTVGCMALGASVVALFNLFSSWPELVKAACGCVLFGCVYLGLNEAFSINRDVSHYIRKWVRL